MEKAYSINGVPIRLTHERWYHITENHDEMAGYFHEVLETLEQPDFVVRGNAGTLKAAKNFGRKKWLVVIYKEVSRSDGFVITSYFLESRLKGEMIWPQR
jgi:hypothetical protein